MHIAAGLSIAAVLSFGAALLILLRDAFTRLERQVWRQLLCAAMILSAAVLAGQLITLLGADSRGSRSWAVLAYGVLAVLTTPLLYQGLIHWNRTRTLVADPGDWLNGVSSVLVAIAAGNTFLPPLRGPWTWSASGWALEISLGELSAGVVVLGTSFAIVVIGGLSRDKRVWLITTSMTLLLLPPAAALLPATGWAGPAQGLALGSAVLIVASAATSPAASQTPWAADTQSTTMGTFVVLLAGGFMLIAAPDSDRLSTVCAGTAVVTMSARFARVVRDLAELAQTRYEALTDELTGIANRRALMQILDGSRSHASVHLLIIDLDEFKATNDKYGHAVGDELLRRVATSFADAVPAGSLLARLGGDEFAVLLTGASLQDALRLGRDLVQAASGSRLVDGLWLKGSASVGLAGDESQELTGDELLRRADIAMYQAKTSRSGLSVYDQESDSRAQEQLALAEDLQLVLGPGSTTREEIQVFFQPQLSLADGRVVGAEALVRWLHPRRGLLAPDRFIDLAERAGLMNSLTARVLDESVAQWKRWRLAGHQLRVSVNLSASSLTDPELLTLLDDVLTQDVDPAQFVLEITETGLMADPVAALATTNAIARRGFGLSIDDYGTGYSSLTYLNDLPATELKIDRSFTGRIATDARTRAIVRGTVQLAHNLGMRLIIEGVEDEATLEMLRTMGSVDTQGYLHSRPLPLEAFAAWLDQHEAAAALARAAYVI